MLKIKCRNCNFDFFANHLKTIKLNSYSPKRICAVCPKCLQRQIIPDKYIKYI